MASVGAQQPGVEFEVKVVRVAGVEARPEGGGGLFVRYYVPAGDGRRRIRVDTREVPCGDGEEAGPGDAFWGELALFERRGGGVLSVGGGVVFELRWRPRRRSSAFLGMGNGRPSSRVLARGELACHDDVAVTSTTSTTQAPASSGTWLRLSPACHELSGCKAPKLLVEPRVIHGAVAGAPAADKHGAVKARSLGIVNQYCCSDGERCAQCGWIGTEDDMFLAATFTDEQRVA
ncbi:hypothetical protein E2562_002756 [Oryza meyeriana var. granulata]|uniref:C2 domain-containing protein n=1 Tax=Oryza meyeriana var. granulata TaxID=110450 RepID=A0A6G1BRJ9_9ORYZ|nr:hypothetical protein E2562_002756 [Oryza meyeriana var. granulata]